MSELRPTTALLALTALNPRRLYHRAELEFADRLPADGAAVIVSNHGRLDFDCFILMRLILRARSRPVRLLANHLWFRLPGVRRLWRYAGAVDGTRKIAQMLLDRGELVLAYPGGAREIMGGRFRREHLDWEGRTGFARIALETGAPVIPVAGLGVNSGHVFLTSGRLLGRLLFRMVLRLGSAYDGYRDPLAIGLLPLPLPFSFAVHLPLPCKLRYVVGEPIVPGAASTGGMSRTSPEAELAARVELALRRLLDEYRS